MQELFKAMLAHLDKLAICPGVENTKHHWAVINILNQLIAVSEKAAKKEEEKTNDPD